MYPFSIGVILDSFRTDLTTALDKAAAVGATGLQVYATSGAFSPESLSPQKRREFLDMCKSRGLTILPTRRRIQNSSSDPSAFWIWPRIWRLTW